MNWNRLKKTKQRTISQIHSIWIRANQRSVTRRKLFSDFIENIPNLIKPDKEGVYKLYYEQNNHIYVINLDHKGLYGGWSFHTTRLDQQKDRDTILEWWISEDSMMKLGQKFNELDNDRGFRIEGICREALDKEINNYLRELFKNKVPPESLIVNINDIDYIIIVNDRLNYPKFKLSNQVDTTIKL